VNGIKVPRSIRCDTLVRFLLEPGREVRVWPVVAMLGRPM
jgi:hypothetical protein